MKTLVLIPARGGSKRIPRKNIKEFCGKPILAYSIENAQKANIFDYIHVSTDDTEIYEIATKLGTKPAFYRSSLTASDTAPVRDVLREALREFEKRDMYFDIICLLSATAPLIEPEDLQKAYNCFKQSSMEYPLLAVARYPVPIEWALKLDKQKNIIEPLNKDLFFASSYNFQPTYYDIGSFAFFLRTHLLNESFDIKFIPYIMPLTKSIDVDCLEDWHLMEKMYKITK